MKKKLLLALMTAMCFMLIAGCGAEDTSEKSEQDTENSSSDAEDEDSDENDTDDEEDVTVPDDTAAADDTIDPLDMPIIEDAGLVFSSYSISNSYYDEDEGMVIAYIGATKLRLLSDDYPELQEAIESYSLDYEKYVTEEFDDFADEAIEINQEDYWTSGVCLYEEWESKVARADDAVVSIVTDYSDYLGGAHGSYFTYPVNFDTATGNKLHIYDVIESDQFDSLFDTLEDELLAKYDSDIFFNADEISSYIADSYDYNEDLHFSLGYEGITFYFQIYELSPYASGSQQVTLTYEDYPDLVKEKYVSDTDEYIIDANLVDSVPGISSELFYVYAYTDDENFPQDQTLVVGFDNDEYVFSFLGYTYDIYLAMIDDRSYLLVNSSSDNDYETLYIYEITDDGVEECGSSYGGFYDYVPLDPNSFRLYEPCNYLSTYNVYRHFHLGDDGLPFTSDLSYFLADRDNPDNYLIPREDMELDVLDPETGERESDIIEEGTVMYFYGTDYDSFVDFILDDGRIIRIDVEDERTIRSRDVEDLFDHVSFSG